MKPTPPEADLAMGLASYLSDQPGIGGRLRAEPEDFRVIELANRPRAKDDGQFTAAWIRLRNWETNRFVGRASRDVGLKRNNVGFAGMKDKRAVTEQWFSFKCPPERLDALEGLGDVEVVEAYRCAEKQYPGAHTGNRFVLRVRDHTATAEVVDGVMKTIADEGGVPHFFGPQRFGSGIRPITHKMGEALVAGRLEEAVHLYCGRPYEGEREDTYNARKVYEETRDPAQALDVYPGALDLERSILKRLLKRPDDWRNALLALPRNLLTLFVHAHQSYIFNQILSARLEAGLGIRTAHVGDRVMSLDGDGVQTHLVTPENQARCQREIDAGRASPSAPLIGTDTPLAEGEPGRIEREVLQSMGIEPADFRCYEMPSLASSGRRRAVLQGVRDVEVSWVEGDPVVGFSLGRGSYATIVMRELMKTEPSSY